MENEWKRQEETDVIAQQHFLYLSKGKAKVSKAPSCSPCQQYDRNVS